MSIQVSEKEGVVILQLSGKIMGGPEAGEINNQINNLIDEGKKKIVIDLNDVEWMNSSGLGILIGAITTLKNNDGQLALINVSDRVENLLKITKLQTLFNMHPDLDAAIASM
ncbi:MAG TPA: anti-sigma factor antagonist [Caldithrix abyssi]|uniref:Anti-sigma factor antagonist n=1 Tax=Caldithrix abyssi TaxID=187145 RepID=A0A7V4WUW6_CALAY|nr:anti-sigma factor antagonist [Caldithrix abyssi]